MTALVPPEVSTVAPDRTARVPRSRAVLLVAGLGALLLGTQQNRVVPMSLGLSPVVLVGFVVAAAMVVCWLAGQRLATPHPPTLVLTLVSFLTTVASTAALTWSTSTNAVMSSSIGYVVRELWIVGLVTFILIVVRSASDLSVVLKGLVAGAALSAGVALVQVGSGIDLSGVLAIPGLTEQGSLLGSDLLRAGGVRPQGMAGHPLELSAVLTVATPLALGLTLSERARGRSGRLWAVATAIILVGAVATISRSAIVGVVAALAIMAWRWPVRRVAVGVIVAVVGVLAAIVGGVGIVARLLEVVLGGSNDNSLGSRASGLDYALGNLPDHPWFGQGAGTYDVAVQPVLDNQYLSRLVETGVVGILGLAVLLIGAWILTAGARARLVDAGRSADAELVNGVLGALTAAIIIGSILDIPGFAQISTLEMILVALGGVAAGFARTSVGADD